MPCGISEIRFYCLTYKDRHIVVLKYGKDGYAASVEPYREIKSASRKLYQVIKLVKKEINNAKL